MKLNKTHNFWTSKQSIPNWLTILRIIFVPFVIIFTLLNNVDGITPTLKNPIYKIFIDNETTIVVNGTFLIAVLFFIIASITDALDGYLARKFHWVSDFGKLWDPLADKILTNSILICLSYLNFIPIWLTLIFIVRDIVVDGYRMMAAKEKIVVAANWFGKIKTILLMVGIIYIYFFGISNNSINGWYFWTVNNLLIYLAALFSIGSGIIYMIQIAKKMKEKRMLTKDAQKLENETNNKED